MSPNTAAASIIPAAKPKIAAYHFTTLVPNLGVVGVGDGRSFIMADLPGLIEGAAEGAGLGIQFLKHVERTKVIVHIVDMSATDGRDPVEDFNKEGFYCYPILVGKKRVFVYFKDRYMSLALALSNLFEHDDNYKDNKPDIVILFGSNTKLKLSSVISSA